jgi:hypothetical protein
VVGDGTTGRARPRRWRRRSALIAFAVTLLAAATGYVWLVLANSRTRLDPEPKIAVQQDQSPSLAAAAYVVARARRLGAGEEDLLLPTARRLRAPFLSDGAVRAAASYARAVTEEVPEAETLSTAAASLSSGTDEGFEAAFVAFREASTEVSPALIGSPAVMVAVARAAATDLRAEASALENLPPPTDPNWAVDADARRARARGMAWAWLVLWRETVSELEVDTTAFETAAREPLDHLAEVAADEPGVFVVLRQDHAEAADRLRQAADGLDALAEAVERAQGG